MSQTARPKSPKPTSSAGLQEAFLQQIRNGTWALHQPIPTEHELAKQHGVCRSTVRKAIQELETIGLLRAIRGKGRTVIRDHDDDGQMIGLIISGREIGSSGPSVAIHQGFLNRICEKGDNAVSFAFNDVSQLPIAKRLRTYSELSGVSLMGPAFPSNDIPELASQLPVVVLARDERSHGIPSFFVDYGYHALEIATRFLAKGHRKIIVTHGRKAFFDRVGAAIDQGVEWAYSLAGVDPSGISKIDIPLGRGGGEELYRYVKQHNVDATAIISYGTWAVSEFYSMAKSQGDHALLSVEGGVLNDIEDPEIANSVTYFRCPCEQLARDAADMLYRIIGGHKPSDIVHSYRGEIVTPSASI